MFASIMCYKIPPSKRLKIEKVDPSVSKILDASPYFLDIRRKLLKMLTFCTLHILTEYFPDKK